MKFNLQAPSNPDQHPNNIQRDTTTTTKHFSPKQVGVG
jgi:hypothetical protein